MTFKMGQEVRELARDSNSELPSKLGDLGISKKQSSDWHKGHGDRKSDHRSPGVTGDRPTLENLGISKKQSSDWQKLAEIPQRDFERTLKDMDRPGVIREVSAAGCGSCRLLTRAKG